MVQIHLTRLNAKSEPDDFLDREVLRIFRHERAASVQWAFEAWRDKSPFFPAISELRALVDEWHRREREEAACQREEAEKREIEAARKEGKLVSYVECIQAIQNAAVKVGRPGIREMPRIAAAAGSLHLTDEQIRERREARMQLTDEQIRERREAQLTELHAYLSAKRQKEGKSMSGRDEEQG